MRILVAVAPAVLMLQCDSFSLQSSKPNTGTFKIGRYATTGRDDDNDDEDNHQMQKQPHQWYTCCSTRELAQAIPIFVRNIDVVAELGAQLRHVSQSIASHCQSAVLVDVERKFPSDSKDRTSAMRRKEDEVELLCCTTGIVFTEIPFLADWRKALFFDKNSTIIGQSNYDVFVLDVSAIVGNDLEWTTFAIIQEFISLNEAFGGTCRTVLVKSAGLNRLASCLVHGQVWIDRGPRSTPGAHIVATVGVQQYRRTMERAVRVGDAVLEVGCHFGTTTALLHEKANADMSGGYCIGVDVGTSIIQRAQNLHQQVGFFVGDAWKTAEILRIQECYQKLHPESNPRRGFDVIYVDVGGLSGDNGVLESIMLLHSLQQALEPRCLVIKSKCMRRLASSMQPFWQSPERWEFDRKHREGQLMIDSDD